MRKLCQKGGDDNFNNYNNNFDFHREVVNMSDVCFEENEMNLMSKGLKYNLNQKFGLRELKQLVVDTENALPLLPHEVRDTNRHILSNKIENLIKSEKQTQFNNNEANLVKNIKKTAKDNQLIITKADKGNAIVILDKDEYIKKTQHSSITTT